MYKMSKIRLLSFVFSVRLLLVGVASDCLKLLTSGSGRPEWLPYRLVPSRRYCSLPCSRTVNKFIVVIYAIVRRRELTPPVWESENSGFFCASWQRGRMALMFPPIAVLARGRISCGFPSRCRNT